MVMVACAVVLRQRGGAVVLRERQWTHLSVCMASAFLSMPRARKKASAEITFANGGWQ